MNQRNMKIFFDVKIVLCQMLCHGHADIAFKLSQDILKNELILMRCLIANFVSTNVHVFQDWIVQMSIKFKSQLNLKCKLILCTFQVN